MACKLLHSTKQAAFVLFYRVLEGGGKGALLTPGTLEWTLVPEIKMGEEKSMIWTLPGKIPTLILLFSRHDAISTWSLQVFCPHYNLYLNSSSGPTRPL